MNQLDHFAEGPEPLPIETTAAVELLDLFRDPDHDVDRIVDFISQDPRLTAETLKRCNNAAFGSAVRTTDVFEAVSRLGFYELYDIISATINSQMWQGATTARTERAMFWERGANLIKSQARMAEAM